MITKADRLEMLCKSNYYPDATLVTVTDIL